MDIFTILFLMLAGHALCDYPLQGQFLAEGKNRHTELGKIYWFHALTAHALIHGGMITIITGRLDLGIAETIIHWLTDWLKCENMISLNTDQAIHVLCKIIWVLIIMYY